MKQRLPNFKEIETQVKISLKYCHYNIITHYHSNDDVKLKKIDFVHKFTCILFTVKAKPMYLKFNLVILVCIVSIISMITKLI